MIEVTDETFDQEVLQSEGPVLVNFGATWCPSCQTLKPIFAQLPETNAKTVYADADLCREAVRRHGVRAVPTLMVFNNGKVVTSHLGVLSTEAMLSLIDYGE